MRVFDSSAIYKAISVAREDVLYHGSTSPLAAYELGNIVFKNSVIFKLYSSVQAKEILSVCDKVLERMNLINSDSQEIYHIAHKYHLSFYDATYVQLADQLKVPIITLDKKLTSKVSTFVEILHFDQIS